MPDAPRQKPLVLLVDDEAVFLEIAATKLRDEGLLTIMAQSIPDAIAKAETYLPDLVLTDIYMPPGPSGWDLVMELRRNPKTRAIKCAFFTSLRDPWAEFHGDCAKVRAELGDICFLSKTEDVDVLGERVEQLIGTRGSR